MDLIGKKTTMSFFLEGSCSKQKWKSTPLSCCVAIWQLRLSNSSLGLSSWFGSFNKNHTQSRGPKRRRNLILPKSLLSKPPLVGGWTTVTHSKTIRQNLCSSSVQTFGVFYLMEIYLRTTTELIFADEFFSSWADEKMSNPIILGGWSRKSQEVKNLGTVTG